MSSACYHCNLIRTYFHVQVWVTRLQPSELSAANQTLMLSRRCMSSLDVDSEHGRQSIVFSQYRSRQIGRQVARRSHTSIGVTMRSIHALCGLSVVPALLQIQRRCLIIPIMVSCTLTQLLHGLVDTPTGSVLGHRCAEDVCMPTAE